MERRQCGEAGPELGLLGLGCWSFGGGEYWGATSQRDVEQVVRRAVELGINYFDTAEAYNDGRSEESLGQALRGVPREQVLIGSKVSPGNTHPQALQRHCEASLRRLQTEYIDVYMIHWPIHPRSIAHFTDDPDLIANPPSIRKAWESLERLRERGLVRYLGVSNFGVARLRELEAVGGSAVVNQLPCNLLSRAIEFEVLPYCKDRRIGVVGYMTLLQGLLGDRYPTLAEVPHWQRRTRHFSCRGNPLCRHGEPGVEKELEEALNRIRVIAREAGTSTAVLALRWAAAVPGMSCCLVGTRSVERLEENVAAVTEPLVEPLGRRLSEATEALRQALGPSLDYYEGTARDRTR